VVAVVLGLGVGAGGFESELSLMPLAHSQRQAGSAALAPWQLLVLGSLQLHRGSASYQLQGAQQRRLLALLLDRRLLGHSWVAEEEVAALLYASAAAPAASPPPTGTLLSPAAPSVALAADAPDLHHQDHERALKALLGRLEKRFGGLVEKKPRRGYRLGTFVTSDAEAFLASDDVSLWRGCYLHQLDDPQLRLAQPLLCQRLAQLLAQNPAEPVRLARLLWAMDDSHPDHLYYLIAALDQSNNRRDAAAMYERARNRLAKHGLELPTHWNWSHFLLHWPKPASAAAAAGKTAP
jgi:hypothetical protein